MVMVATGEDGGIADATWRRCGVAGVHPWAGRVGEERRMRRPTEQIFHDQRDCRSLRWTDVHSIRRHNDVTRIAKSSVQWFSTLMLKAYLQARGTVELQYLEKSIDTRVDQHHLDSTEHVGKSGRRHGQVTRVHKSWNRA